VPRGCLRGERRRGKIIAEARPETVAVKWVVGQASIREGYEIRLA